MLASLQDPENYQKNHTTPTLDNKATASPTKTSACASVHTPATSPSVQHNMNTSSPASCNLPQYAYNKHEKSPSSITTQQSESSSACLNIILSNCSSNSKISPRPKNTEEISSQGRYSNRQIKPTVHLFSIDDLDHAK